MLFRVVFLFGFLVAAGCGREPARPSVTERPDLVLVTIDTLRADRAGRGLMPHLDGLAARGLQFTHARATAPLTLPSHVSMLTGALPPAHGVRENGVHVFRGSPPSIARTLGQRGSPQINGGNGRNVNYQIDGGDNNDDTVGGLLQLSRSRRSRNSTSSRSASRPSTAAATAAC